MTKGEGRLFPKVHLFPKAKNDQVGGHLFPKVPFISQGAIYFPSPKMMWGAVYFPSGRLYPKRLFLFQATV